MGDERWGTAELHVSSRWAPSSGVRLKVATEKVTALRGTVKTAILVGVETGIVTRGRFDFGVTE